MSDAGPLSPQSSALGKPRGLSSRYVHEHDQAFREETHNVPKAFCRTQTLVAGLGLRHKDEGRDGGCWGATALERHHAAKS